MFNMKRRMTAMAMAVAVASSVVCGTGVFTPTMSVKAAESEAVYESSSSVSAEVDFSGLTEEDWGNKAEVVYAYTNDVERSIDANFSVTAKISVSAADYEAMGDSDYIKFQGIIKDENWTYTKGDSWPMVTKADLEADGDVYSANITVDFTDETATLLQEVDFEIVGVGFKGTVNISDVAVQNAATETSSVVYEGTTTVAQEIDFSELTEEDWGSKAEVVYAYTNDVERSLDASFSVTAKITVNADGYESMSDSDYIKFQGVIKDENWTYTTGDSWPMLTKADFVADGDAYSANITVEFKDETAALLNEVDFEIVGVGFKGTVNISDVVVENAPEVYSVVIYESDASVTVTEEVDFSELTEEDWGVKAEVVFEYTNDKELELTENFTVDSKITISAADYEAMGDSDYIKFQGVIKDENWTYTTGDSWPMLTKADFVADGDAYSANITVEFKDETAALLYEIDFEVVGAGYKGAINFSDVVVTTLTTEEPELEKMDPIVLSDLSTEENYNGWGTETGWDYYHGGTVNSVPVISYDSENERLKVSVDYSANSSSTWSEAKVKFTPSEAVDISNYNQLSVDIIYPDELDGTKMKFFSDAGINKDTTIDETTAEDLGNGMKKVTVTMGFSPSSTPLESVTIGIIGYQTSFVGDVYLDNLVLSQNDPSADYVEITATVEDEADADISKTPDTITLADAEALDCAKALFTYLYALKEGDQVLFGHQNDVSRAVNGGDLGDVYDVTGSVSGVFAIDSLSLTGSEAGGENSADALEKSVAESLQAAENGAIVSLSTHMPNFTNSKVIKNEDGTYDFFNCDFAESKDISNDSATKILPGGEYNDAFNAYLDIIADYALQLQDENIPIMFRPFHENTGSWFWWGSTNSAETYKSLFRYTVDYLESKGVHNMLYVYSPCGPLTSEEEYLTRYPGDDYVDILAFDYYDDYGYGESYDASFFENLEESCKVVSSLAAKKGKLSAIAETGVRVKRADGSQEGLLVSGNPVSEANSGVNWYSKVSEIAMDNDMPYWLIWANFSDSNFYVPYKYDDTLGHEMINEFIDYYNEDSSVFGLQTNFYNNIDALVASAEDVDSEEVSGYMVYPHDLGAIVEATTLQAAVKNAENAEKISFVITANGMEHELEAVTKTKASTGATSYYAELTAGMIDSIGKTDTATISLVADGEVLASVENISIGKEKDKAPANLFDNFEYYSGSDGLLSAAYGENAGNGGEAEFVLDTENKADGTYGGAFKYTFVTSGAEAYAGQCKTLENGDFSDYNAIQMWVKPDGEGQKLIIQLTDASGEEFEVNLSDFVKTTDAKWVTIPFSSFIGKNNGTLDTANITKFSVYCNSISDGALDLSSVIYFDAIEAVSLDADLIDVEAGEYILSNNPLGYVEPEITTPEPTTQAPTETTTGETVTTAGGEDGGQPDTGDNATPVVFGLMGAAALGGVVALRRKKETVEE